MQGLSGRSALPPVVALHAHAGVQHCSNRSGLLLAGSPNFILAAASIAFGTRRLGTVDSWPQRTKCCSGEEVELTHDYQGWRHRLKRRSNTLQNMGAQMVKEVASKTSDIAGEGTTTATVLAQSISVRALRRVATGANLMAIKRGIEKAVEAVCGSFRLKGRPQAWRARQAVEEHCRRGNTRGFLTTAHSLFNHTSVR